MSQSVTDSGTEFITAFDIKYDTNLDTREYNWEGRTFDFDHHTQFKIEEQHTEVVDPRMATIHGSSVCAIATVK